MSSITRSVLIIFMALSCLHCLPYENQEAYAGTREIYFTVKSGKVNFRAGPGVQYPVKHMISCVNYPVRLLDEFQGWRKVSDFKGNVGWISTQMLKISNHNIVAKGYDILSDADFDADLPKDTAIVMRLPSAKASPIVGLKIGVIVKVNRCMKSWCQIEASITKKRKVKGWVLENALWIQSPSW